MELVVPSPGMIIWMIVFALGFSALIGVVIWLIIRYINKNQ